MIPCLLSSVLSIIGGCSYWVMTMWAFRSHITWASVCVRAGTVVLTLIIMILVKWFCSFRHFGLLRSLIAHMQGWGSALGYEGRWSVTPSWWQWCFFDHLLNFQQTANVPLSPSARNVDGTKKHFLNGQVKKITNVPTFYKKLIHSNYSLN